MIARSGTGERERIAMRRDRSVNAP